MGPYGDEESRGHHRSGKDGVCVGYGPLWVGLPQCRLVLKVIITNGLTSVSRSIGRRYVVNGVRTTPDPGPRIGTTSTPGALILSLTQSPIDRLTYDRDRLRNR